MTKSSLPGWLRIICLVLSSAGILATIILQAFNGPQASEEWKYTARVMTILWFPIFLIVFIFSTGLFKRLFFLGHFWIILVLGLIAVIAISIPMLSPDVNHVDWPKQIGLSVCWIIGFLSIGVLFFILGSRASVILSWFACLVGSICLGFGIGELWLLCTEQPSDGIIEDQFHSRYLPQGAQPFTRESWVMAECGITPKKGPVPYTIGHRQLKKDMELFDVKYTMTTHGRRLMPQSKQAAKNDLLLFGCSFTFGNGLEDDENWPWLLAQDLGPDWQVENYSQIGFGAMQLLCMLENHLVEMPESAHRIALFLAIKHHLVRNDFFLHSPNYGINASGEPVREDNPKYTWLTEIPKKINGSQLAREVLYFMQGKIAANNEKFKNDYLAMLKKSAFLLSTEYKTPLIVLLWPDLEYLGPELEKEGIKYLSLKEFLPEWDQSQGTRYFIKSPYEDHPNALAATLIADGLKKYLDREAPAETGQ